MPNSGAVSGIRRFGEVEVITQLYMEDADTPKAHMGLRLSVVQPLNSGVAPKVSINAARITLQEGGRRIAGRLDGPVDRYDLFGKNSRSSGDVMFPASIGKSENLRVTFGPGAVKVGGQLLDLAPIRFELKTSPEIYMFPCIPA